MSFWKKVSQFFYVCLFLWFIGISSAHAELIVKVIYGNWIVEDTVARTLWDRDLHDRKTYSQAHQHCNQLDLGEITGWKMPNQSQVTNFLSQPSPTSGAYSGYNGSSNYHWTTTFHDHFGGVDQYKIVKKDGSGLVASYADSTQNFGVRCMRQLPSFDVNGVATAPEFISDKVSVSQFKQGSSTLLRSYWKDLDDPIKHVKVRYKNRSGGDWVVVDMSQFNGYTQLKAQYNVEVTINEPGIYDVQFAAASEDGASVTQSNWVNASFTLTVQRDGVTPPFFVGGAAKYNGYYVGSNVGFFANWQDPDGDPYILNAKMRYKHQDASAWSSEYPMTHDVGGTYTTFRTNIPINGGAGTYQVQFKASSASDASGADAVESEWSPTTPRTFEMHGVSAPQLMNGTAFTDNTEITFRSEWHRPALEPITNVKVRYSHNNSTFQERTMTIQPGNTYKVTIPFAPGYYQYQFQATSSSEDGSMSATSAWSEIQTSTYSGPNQAPGQPNIALNGVTLGSGADEFVATFHVSAVDPDGDKVHINCLFGGSNPGGHEWRNVDSGAVAMRGIGYPSAVNSKVECTARDIYDIAGPTKTVYFNIQGPQFTLHVNKSGGGVVSSSPAGISCGSNCSASFVQNSRVTLTATPDSGQTFSGWSGAGVTHCTTQTCEIVMTKDFTISAVFTETQPDPEPVVTNFSPTTATLGELTTFTIIGQNLTNTTAAWIHECVGSGTGGLIEVNHTSATRQTFQCTPSYSAGEKGFQIKDQPNGAILQSGTVTIQEPDSEPVVTNFSPTTATLGELTTFTIIGQNLTNTTAAWVHECVGSGTGGLIEVNHTSATRQTFQCTPSYSAGEKGFQIKKESGGTILRSGTITIQEDNSAKLQALYEEKERLEAELQAKRSSLEDLKAEQISVPREDEITQAGELLEAESESQLDVFNATTSKEVNPYDPIWEESGNQIVTLPDNIKAYAYNSLDGSISGKLKYLVSPHTTYVVYGTEMAEEYTSGANYPALVWTEYHKSVILHGEPLTSPRFIVNNYQELKEIITDLESSASNEFFYSQSFSALNAKCSLRSTSLIAKATCTYYKTNKKHIDTALQLTIEEIRNELVDLTPAEREKVVRFITSLVLDIVPFVGSVKSVGQLVLGKDLITKEDVSRTWELIGIIPYAKIGIKATAIGITTTVVAYRIAQLFVKHYKKSKYPTKWIDLTAHRRNHILDNHRNGMGKPRKTEFPESWSDAQIIHHISDVATDPALKIQYETKGSTVYPFLIGERNGSKIRVDLYGSNSKFEGLISSGYPIDVPRNPD